MSRRTRVDETDMLPHPLRGIYLRTTFGLQTNEDSMNAIASTSKDEEIIGVVSNRVALIHCNDPVSADHKIRTFYPVCPVVSAIKFINQSPSKAFVACSVTIKSPSASGKTHAVIYATDKDNPLYSKPSIVSYEMKSWAQTSSSVFTTLIFSHQEADHLAGIIDENTSQQGILVFDWLKNELIQQIPVNGSVTSLSFFPKDSWKLCCSGYPNLLQYWHFNGRYANQAPIGDADMPKRDYSCHIWLDEQNMLTGSTDGYVSLIKGCDVIQYLKVFEKLRDGDTCYDEISVDHIVHNADMVIVCNAHNIVAFLEIKRVDYSKKDSAIKLAYVNRFVFGQHSTLCGLCWAFDSEFSNTLIVASRDSIELYEFEKILETVEMPIVIKPRETIASFHSGSINLLSVPCKTGTILSSSNGDDSLRLWAMNNEKNECMFKMYFPDGVGLPMTVNAHPSGRRMASGDEDFYKEYAITDTNIESMQEFSVKVSLTAPHGEAFANTLPCSKVLYSNGGHLMAVITGRLGQVFNMFNLTYGIEGAHPTRIMVMMDHVTTISDICFNSTDSKLFTCAYDGTICEYEVGNSVKVREHAFKSMPVIALRCSPSDRIVALVEPDLDAQVVAKRKTTRRSSLALSARNSSNSLKETEKTTISQYLCVWEKDISKEPHVTDLTGIEVKSMDVGKFHIDHDDAPDYVAFGTANGKVVVSLFPLPVKPLQSVPPEIVPIPKTTSSQVSPAVAAQNRKQSIQMAKAANAAGVGVDKKLSCDDVLNLKYCKSMQIHSGPVSCVVVADSGFWIISGGEDGAINIIGTTRRYGPDVEIPECTTPESTVGLVDIINVRNMSKKVSMMETQIEDTIVRKDREITHVKMFSEKQIHKLENVLKREMHKRDTIIIQERNENIRKAKEIVREYEEKLEADKTAYTNLEVKYEKKLAKEGAYLDKMKQSYDEFVVHARLDLEKSKRDAKRLAEEYENDSASHEIHLNKTKEQLLQYVDYMRERYNEVTTQVEDSHAAKMSEVLLKLEDAQKANDIAAAESKEHTNLLVRDIRSLKEQVLEKESALDKAMGDLDWANGKVARLEEALEKATSDIERRTDEISKWEFKAGEQRQQLSEFERIRKVLVSQLQMVRQDLRPREEKLIIANRDILDGEREYQTTIQAMSDKQKSLAFQTEKMHGLQEQFKNVKRKLFEKESLLSNAANLFREYKYALQRATFDRKKLTVVDPAEKFPVTGGNPSMNKSIGDPTASIWEENTVQNNMVEILSKNSGMESALKRLDKLLGGISSEDPSKEYIHQSSDEELVAAEQKRNMLLMHRNLRVLKSSKNNADEAAELKENKQIKENRNLIEMLNGLKQQLTLVSREKQMWKAKADTLEMQLKSSGRKKGGEMKAIIPLNQEQGPDTGRPASPALSYTDSIMSIPTLDGEIENVDAPVINMSAKDKIDAIYRDNEMAIVSGLKEHEDDDDTSGSMLDILAHHMRSVAIPPGQNNPTSPTDILNRVTENPAKPIRKQKKITVDATPFAKKSLSTPMFSLSNKEVMDLSVNAQSTKIVKRSQVKLPRVSPVSR